MTKNNIITIIVLVVIIFIIIYFIFADIFNIYSLSNDSDYAKLISDEQNISNAVSAKYKELLESYKIYGVTKSQKQIYYEIATGVAGDFHGKNFQQITKTGAKNMGITVPSIENNSRNSPWYLTDQGNVFSVNGVRYNNKTYFNANVYYKGKLPNNQKYSGEYLAAKITETILKGEYVVE